MVQGRQESLSLELSKIISHSLCFEKWQKVQGLLSDSALDLKIHWLILTLNPYFLNMLVFSLMDPIETRPPPTWRIPSISQKIQYVFRGRATTHRTGHRLPPSLRPLREDPGVVSTKRRRWDFSSVETGPPKP